MQKGLRGAPSVYWRTIDNWHYLGLGPPFCKQAGRVLYALKHVQQWEANGGVLRVGGPK